MASIDFRGVDGVLGAYKAKNIETWAVFNKKNFMQSGEGEQALNDYLEMMCEHGSTTTYTLKVFRTEQPDDITDKTECNGSFCFSLTEGRSGMGMMSGFIGGNNIGSRLAAIEKKLSGEEKEPESVGKIILNTVVGWLEDPNDVVKILGAVKMFMGKSSPAEVMQTVSALGAVEPERAGANLPGAVSDLTVEQEQTLQRFAQVVNRLERCDPEILLHLEQLATLAETNPAMYKMALSFLK